MQENNSKSIGMGHNTPEDVLVFKQHDKELFRINEEGNVVLNKDAKINEATKTFWDAVNEMQTGLNSGNIKELTKLANNLMSVLFDIILDETHPINDKYKKIAQKRLKEWKELRNKHQYIIDVVKENR